MSEGRRQLEAVPGLSRTESIPAPPPRRRAAFGREEGGGAEAPPVPEAQERVSPAAPRASAPSPPRSDQQTIRAITLSLPGSLVAQVKSRARATGVTQPDFLMDAVTAAHEQLPALLSHDRPGTVDDGLFLRRTTPRAAAEPLSTLSLRLLGPNVAAIDTLVASTGAPSRSALCAAALRYYLDR